VPKLIIYLDQNFVSNMAKAKFLGDPGLASKLHDYAVLYDRLKMLVDGDRVICPESLFHSLETIDLKLAKAAQSVVSNLSYGLSLRSPWEVARFQAYRAAREFLKLPREEAPEWQDAFEDDPHEPVDNRTVHLGKGRALATIAWQTDSSPPTPVKYMNDRKAANGKFSWPDLPVRIRVQKDGLIQCLYGSRINECSIGEAGLLWDSWQSLGAPEERLADFLKADELRNCPFIDILSTLSAALDCEKGRGPREGDALDTLIMAVVLPYCDVVATSKDMVALLIQTGLVKSYRARLYSAKPQEVQSFSDSLEPL